MESSVRLFFDSNVILSGLLSSKGAPRILLDLLSLEVPRLHGMTGQYNLDEITRNLGRFPGLEAIYQSYLPHIHLAIIEIPPYRALSPFLGKMSAKDAPVLASAVLGKADFLITGDKKGFPHGLAKPINIIYPGDFLEKILPGLVGA